MKNLKNFVILKGRLGIDPELKNLENGNKLARFSLATNESYKNGKGEWIEKTTWHNCIGWDKIAEKTFNSLKKGTEVLVKGKLAYRQYEDKEGIKRQLTNIVIEDFIAIPKKEAA